MQRADRAERAGDRRSHDAMLDLEIEPRDLGGGAHTTRLIEREPLATRVELDEHVAGRDLLADGEMDDLHAPGDRGRGSCRRG
jgi:hypothetical protein